MKKRDTLDAIFIEKVYSARTGTISFYGF